MFDDAVQRLAQERAKQAERKPPPQREATSMFGTLGTIAGTIAGTLAGDPMTGLKIGSALGTGVDTVVNQGAKPAAKDTSKTPEQLASLYKLYLSGKNSLPDAK